MSERWGSVVVSLRCWGFAIQGKGKAAIVVVCNPLGKSGGALIRQLLIPTWGSLANSTSYFGVILLVIVLAWLVVVSSLDTPFTLLAKKDLKNKLVDGKISTISLRQKLQRKSGVEYRFISSLNSMGFIEGDIHSTSAGCFPLMGRMSI